MCIARTDSGSVLVPVLRGVNLEVTPGEWVAILGPSGSAKSTLLNLLGLLDRPNRGTYELEGEAASGSLPRGDVTGTIQKLGGFRALLGTGGTGTSGGTGSGGTGTGGGRGSFGGGRRHPLHRERQRDHDHDHGGHRKGQRDLVDDLRKPVTAAESDVTPGDRVTVRQDSAAPSSDGQLNTATVVIQPASASTTSGSGT